MRRLIILASKALGNAVEGHSAAAISRTVNLDNASISFIKKCSRSTSFSHCWASSRSLATAASPSVIARESVNQSTSIRVDEAEFRSPLSMQTADEFRSKHKITVQDGSGSNAAVPDPVQTFEQAEFPPLLLEMMRKVGYKSPTPIQAQAWPIANSGRDLIAIASTGSGKTAGFLVPALNHIREVNRKGKRSSPSPIVLVLAPTRELACQTKAEAIKLGGSLGLRTACLFGGASKYGQTEEIRAAPHIIVATPGRLLDFAESGTLSLKSISYLVLDEADRMLDMGFERDLREILVHVPAERQTLFFSATWPSEVRQVASKFASNSPVQLFVGDVSDRPVAATTIAQKVTVLGHNSEKVDALVEYLGTKAKGDRVIIFVAKKDRCDWLADHLEASGRSYKVAVIHGDKMQRERDRALQSFKMGRSQILIATDVASRGLDVKDVVSVVNFDCPNDAESYVHRIGRTGRAGALGESMTFLAREDAGVARSIAKVMREAGQETSKELEDLIRSSGGGERRSFGTRGGGRGGRGGAGGRGWRGGGYRGGEREVRGEGGSAYGQRSSNDYALRNPSREKWIE